MLLPGPDGELAPAGELRGVRFERVHAASGDAHRAADGGAGLLFVDAVNTGGAFEVPAGAVLVIEGREYLAARVERFEGPGGRAHHWEVELT